MRKPSFFILLIVGIIFFILIPHSTEAQYSPIGTFDAAYNTTCSVAGWAKDPDTTDPVLVHIYKDAAHGQGGIFVAAVKADLLRSGLPYTDKNHGFSYSFDVSSGLFDNQDHPIYIYGIDATGDSNALLNGNPKTINCAAPEYFSINTGQPYAIGAWYFTAWNSIVRKDDWVLIEYAEKVYGRTNDPWGGTRDHALGADPWGIGMDYSSRKPLLGFYDLMDQRIMDAHILQAASRGLSYFAFYWYWDKDKNAESKISTPLQKFISSPEKSKMKFMIAPIMLGAKTMTLSDWENNVVPYMVNNYIGDSSYLTTTDGRPIINDFSFGFTGDVASHATAITILRNAVKAKTGKDPVITFVAQEVHTSADLQYAKNTLNLNGFQSFIIGPLAPAEPYSQTISRWQSFIEKQQPYFHIPCATVGLDRRPWYKLSGWGPDVNSAPYNTDITPEIFRQHLTEVKQYLDNNPLSTAKAITIYAWNEWGEGGIIEPGQQKGYQYLDIIQNVFGLSSKNPAPSLPSDIVAPSVPSEISATSTSSSQINLSWNASIDNFEARGYRIYRNGNLIVSVTPATQNPSIRQSYSDKNLSSNTTYTYTISTYDLAGNMSVQSNPISVRSLSAADLNSDGKINSIDFGILLSYWNSTSKPKADINQDGLVNAVDFGIMLSGWNS